MTNYLIGNIIMFISSVLMTLAGLPKSKKTCIFLQIIQIFGMAIGNLFLGSFPGFFVNCCSAIRNIFAYHNKLGKPHKIIIIIVSLVVSLIFNDIGILIIFPVLSLISFTLFMDTQNVISFKLLVIFSNILWFVHDISIGSYVAVIFDILGTVTNLIGIYNIQKIK